MSLRHPLSIQLYSGRKFPPPEAQLRTVARHGFTNVETFGPWNEDPAATRDLLDRHGLTVASAHFSVDWLENQFERTIDTARTLGVRTLVAPYLLPEARPTDRAGWTALGERLARCRDRVASAGFRLAWHNHDFEFAPLPDGTFPIEHILGADLLWEADLAWIVRGGAEPSAWIDRYRGRIPLVHVKDIAAAGQGAGEDGWADVGTGVLPWPRLWAECVAAGAETMIAEHDNPSDFDRFARVSAQAMRDFESARSS